MNKSQIICPVVAMMLTAFVFGLFGIRGQRRAAILVASYSIGRELITSTNSSHLVSVGPEMQAHLSGLLNATTRVSTVVLLGDEPRPIGDGRACSRLILTNDAGHGLVVRLRQEPGTKVFNVLG